MRDLNDLHCDKIAVDGRRRVCRDCVYRNYEFNRYRPGSDPRRQPATTGYERRSQGMELLSLRAFGSNVSTDDGRTSHCRPCDNRVSRIRLEGGTRNHRLERRDGLTDAEVEQLIDEQGGGCAVCRVNKPEHVDHDHRTGKVRDILCFNFNGGLGRFTDDIVSSKTTSIA